MDREAMDVLARVSREAAECGSEGERDARAVLQSALNRADSADDWRPVLSALAKWCVTHPNASEVFEFAVDGFLRLAKLTKPAEALALLNALSDSAPFETLRDAFLAHADRAHLHRLAPERQHIAIELMNRFSPPPPQQPGSAAGGKPERRETDQP